MDKEIKTFETGKTYRGRSIGDSDCIWDVTIIKRTAKTVTIKEPMTNNIVRKKLHIYDNSEAFYPMSQYRMAVIIRAEKLIS